LFEKFSNPRGAFLEALLRLGAVLDGTHGRGMGEEKG
jgi:hypothetical protein